jgi:hypothetical protein
MTQNNNFKVEKSLLTMDAIQMSTSAKLPDSTVPIIKNNHQVSWGSSDLNGSLTIQNPTSFIATNHIIAPVFFANYILVQDRQTTTDATLTIVQTITLAPNTSALFKTNVIGRRTAGGAVGDRNVFVVNFVGDTNALGLASVSGITPEYTLQSNGTTAVTISALGTAINISVTGVAAETFVWFCNTEIMPSFQY